jgi:hypothetical protein
MARHRFGWIPIPLLRTQLSWFIAANACLKAVPRHVPSHRTPKERGNSTSFWATTCNRRLCRYIRVVGNQPIILMRSAE